MSKGLMGEFKCTNDNCKNKDVIVEVFYWTDSNYPECKICKKEMDISFQEKREVPSVLKFNAMSPNQKRAVLKERSNKHFHKRIEEKQREMLRPDTL